MPLKRIDNGLTPDVVTLDIELPRLGGLDVYREMKAHAKHAQRADRRGDRDGHARVRCHGLRVRLSQAGGNGRAPQSHRRRGVALMRSSGIDSRSIRCMISAGQSGVCPTSVRRMGRRANRGESRALAGKVCPTSPTATESIL